MTVESDFTEEQMEFISLFSIDELREICNYYETVIKPLIKSKEK